MLLEASKGLIVDGQWKDNPDDENEITTTEPIYTLLESARRMPEVIVILSCKEETSVSRMLADSEEDLKVAFEQKMEKRQADLDKKREEDRAEKKQGLLDDGP